MAGPGMSAVPRVLRQAGRSFSKKVEAIFFEIC
jgi:hypothetical protein